MKNYASIQQVANSLGVSRATIYNLIYSKKITAYKVGRKTLLQIEEVEDYLRKNIKKGKGVEIYPKGVLYTGG